MAASKTSELTALAGESVATGDLLPIVDVSATTAGSKKITLAEFHETYPVVITTALAGSGLHATEDKFPVWDNGVPKYMLSTELQNGLFATATAITSGVHATQDTLLYDDNGAAKKITVPNLCNGFFEAVSTEMTGAAAVGTDEMLFSDGGVAKTITVTELTTAIALLGFTLADIPTYADQAAAATALTGTGRLFRFNTTGALGVTIT